MVDALSCLLLQRRLSDMAVDAAPPPLVQVSRHKRCRVRITVADRPGVVKQDGHKVVLTAVMVSQFTVRLTTYDIQVDLLHKATI